MRAVSTHNEESTRGQRVVSSGTSQAAIYLVGTGAAAAIQFFTLPILTRALGTTAYGTLALVLTVSMALMGVMGLGSDMVLGRFWFESDNPEGRRRIASDWIRFLMIWCVAIAGVAAVAAYFVTGFFSQEPGAGLLVVLGIVGLIPQLLATMLAQVLRNEFRPWPFAITNIVQTLLRALVGLLLVVGFGMGVLGVLLGMLAADVTIALVRLRLVRLPWRGRLDWHGLRPLIRFGVPFVPGSLAFWAYSGLDRLVLARYEDVSIVGAYAAAAALLAPFTIVMTAVGQAWLPSITNLFSRSRSAAASAIGLGLEGAVLGYGAMSLAIGYLAEFLLVLLAGEDYALGARAVPFLALGYVFWGASVFAATGSTMAKKSGLTPVIAIVSVGVQFVALLLLVPRYGIAGAGLSAALGYFTMTVGFLAYSQATFRIRIPGVAISVEAMLLSVAAALATLLGHDNQVLLFDTALVLLGALRLGYLWRRRGALLADL